MKYMWSVLVIMPRRPIPVDEALAMTSHMQQFKTELSVPLSEDQMHAILTRWLASMDGLDYAMEIRREQPEDGPIKEVE